MKNLKGKKWIPNIIENLFQVTGSVTTKPSEIIANGSTPRITCASTQNGLDDCYKNKPTEDGGVLTVDSATIGSVFFQPYNFIATDHVEKIQRESSPFSENEGLFLQTAITTSVGTKYQYGYKFSQTRIKRQNIMLPINKNGKPDYNYMSKYVGESKKKLLAKYQVFAEKQISKIEYKKILDINKKQWNPFPIVKIFEPIRGHENNMAMLDEGNVPLISAKNTNNGLKGFVKTLNKQISGNCISLNNDGDGGAGLAYYQPSDMALDTHVTALIGGADIFLDSKRSREICTQKSKLKLH